LAASKRVGQRRRAQGCGESHHFRGNELIFKENIWIAQLVCEGTQIRLISSNAGQMTISRAILVDNNERDRSN
jgi:hypothetical protein